MAEQPPPDRTGPDGVAVVDSDEATRRSRAESEGLGPLGPGAVDPVVAAPKRGYGPLFWAAAVWLGIVMVSAALADVLPVQDPNTIDVSRKNAPPFSPGRLLGGDGLGRDILSRLVHGSRVSVIISLAAVGIGMTAGGTLGMSIGFFRGRIEQFVVAVIDIILAFPGLVILLALVAYMGQSLPVIAFTIGVLSIPIYTRIARANTLSLAQREFVLAARAMGARSGRILFREIFPNVVLPVMAFGLIAMGTVIVLEGALAFLGLSVELPQATWGGMIAEGNRHIFDTVHVALIPSGVMFLTVLSLNFVGDSLRTRFDVRESNL